MIDFADAVLDDDFAADWTVRSVPAAVVLSDGIVVEQTEETRTVRGIVHPASSKETMHLPDGIASKGAVVGFFVERLVAANVPAGARGEQILFDGDWYEVHLVDRWAQLGNFYRVVATRVGQ